MPNQPVTLRFTLPVILCVAFGARADVPAGMPPDIAAIMDKIHAGQRPSLEDAEKLKQWQQSVLKGSKQPVPKGAIIPDGIPCHVRITWNAVTGGTESIDLAADADVLLYPNIAGTADYSLSPTRGSSTFRFEPIGLRGTVDGYVPGERAQQGGGLASRGHGTVTRIAHQTGGVGNAQGNLSDTAFVGLMVTTGGDALLAGGKVTAVISGTRIVIDPHTQKPRTESIHGFEELTKYVVPIDSVVPFTAEASQPSELGKPAPKPTMKLSYRALVTAIQSGKTEKITSSEQFATQAYKGSSTFELTIRPPALELAIQPQDEADYERWLPFPDVREGGDKKLFGVDPKPFPIRIALHDTSKGAATGTAVVSADAPIPCDVEVTFVGASTNEGIAMNYPPQDSKAEKPDLFFPTQGQPPGAVVTDGKKLTLKHTKELVVMVAARDTGAYAFVHAECTDVPVTSHDPRTHAPDLSMPMDDNLNFVADAWEKDKHTHPAIYDRNYPANWDGETAAAGISAIGDGLSLFEEYRGVIEEVDGKEKFTRLDPTKMKLFLWLDGTGPDVELWRKGAQLYAASTGVTIHYVHDGYRLHQLDGVVHWLNFRSTAHTTDKQCALVVKDGAPASGDLGFTMPIQSASPTRPLTPATTEFVNVSRKNAEWQVATWLSWLPKAAAHDGFTTVVKGAEDAGVDLATVRGPIDATPLVKRAITWSMLHELGHATGGQHHDIAAILEENNPDTNSDPMQRHLSSGEAGCPMRYWNAGEFSKADLVRFLVKGWTLEAPPAGGAWKFCTADAPNIRIKPR